MVGDNVPSNPILQEQAQLKAAAAEWIEGRTDAATALNRIHEELARIQSNVNIPDNLTKVGMVLPAKSADDKVLAKVDSGVDKHPDYISFSASPTDPRSIISRHIDIDLTRGEVITANDDKAPAGHQVTLEKDYSPKFTPEQRAQQILDLAAGTYPMFANPGTFDPGSQRRMESLRKLVSGLDHAQSEQVQSILNNHPGPWLAANGLDLKTHVDSREVPVLKNPELTNYNYTFEMQGAKLLMGNVWIPKS